MKKSLLTLLLLAGFFQISQAQNGLNFPFLEKSFQFEIGGGTLKPGPDLASTSANGLFARNGGQFNLGFQGFIYKPFGLGFQFDYQSFGFRRSEFLAASGASFMEADRTFGSPRFALKGLIQVPFQLYKDKVHLLLCAEGLVGLSSLRTPRIILEYSELENKYTRVEYRSRGGTHGFLGASAGVKLFIGPVFGVYFNKQFTFRSRHTAKYSVRSFDAEGNLYESENYLHQFMDSEGYTFGLVFRVGGK